jgi:hypothetical protein
MPLKPIDYSKTIFYKLACKDTSITDIYVGHTTNFNTRKSHHKTRCENLNNPKSQFRVYRFIRDHGGFSNWDMVKLEQSKCVDKKVACKRERYFLELLQATLNKVIPGRTNHEYTLDTKEFKREYDKIYRDINRETRYLKKKEYREKNKDYLKRQARIRYLRKQSKKWDEIIDALMLNANVSIA